MKVLLIIYCLFQSICLLAQKGTEPSLYVFDDDWKPCKIEVAKYLGVFRKLSDTAYQWKYYHFDGPLMSIETYKDKESQLLHGKMLFFGADGKVDSSGSTYEGKKDGWWYYMTDSLTILRKEKYVMGKLIQSMDSTAIRLEDEENRIKSERRLMGDEVDASFEGGDKAWAKFIQKQVTFPQRAKSLNKSGKVVVQFIIDAQGNVVDVEVTQSVEYSLDEEAIRMIKKSPKWKPAYQGGRNVKAYRRQPLTFQLPK